MIGGRMTGSGLVDFKWLLETILISIRPILQQKAGAENSKCSHGRLTHNTQWLDGVGVAAGQHPDKHAVHSATDSWRWE